MIEEAKKESAMPVPTKNTEVTRICDRLNTLYEGTRKVYLPRVFDMVPGIRADQVMQTEAGQRARELFKPELETMDWDAIPGPPARQKAFRPTYEALAICMMQRVLAMKRTDIEEQIRTALDIGLIETVLSGTGGIGVFTRQLIAVVKRAVPKLFAPQLVPVRPMTGPTAKIYWLERLYGTAYSSSAPNVAVGDDIADMSKLNKDYALMSGTPSQEGLISRKLGIKVDTSITVEAEEYRVHGEFSNIADIDYADQFADEVGMGSLDMVMKWNLSDFLVRETDKNILYAIRNGIAAYGTNVQTYDIDPTIGSTAWGSQLPSERMAYRESIYADGIAPLFTKIATSSYSHPTWCVAGPQMAEWLLKANQIRMVGDMTGGSLVTGGANFMFLGGMDSNRTTVFVDYTQSVPTNSAYFGSLPSNPMDPAIYYCPRTPIKFFQNFTDPKTGLTSMGAWTTFGLGVPQAGTPISTQMAWRYGELQSS